ncbi:MAG: ShlB/FhaC/HecB family hemolysin secretion/activation protein [Candidatus Omnitrophica bacterium]|nr:ShlB/FhaC/HecB family hemolysin secretion/activation protein [Candidatus Omnitrophota bacterium]
MKRWLVIFVLCLVSVAPTVWGANPVNKEEATRELVTQTDMLRTEEEPPFQKPQKKSVVEEEAEKAEPEAAGPPFLVKKILVEGNTLIPSKDLLAQAPSFEGRKLTLRELQRFTDIVTAIYRGKGYTTTRAYIPPQKVINGVVTIRVLEGRVGKVEVAGNCWFRKLVYRNAVPIKPGEMFEMAKLENGLQNINAAPDRAAQAFLAPGKEKGTTDVILKAKDKFPLHVSYEFNRRGTNLTHWGRHIIHLTDNNLFGFGDQLRAQLSMAEQGALLAGAFHYEFPWQKTGTVYYFDGGVAKSRLLKELRPLDVTGKSFSLAPGVTQTFFETSSLRLGGDLRFEIKDAKTDVGNDKLSFDRMRVLVGGPRFSMNDHFGRTLAGADIHVGIPDLMGGSPKHDPSASRVDSGGQFVYGTMNMARLQRLYMGSFLVLQGSGQLSASPLTALEQYYLGGMYSVRGYPENDSSGDKGYNLSAEVRVPPYFIPASWKIPGMKNKTWRDTFSTVGFIEGGQVFNLKRQQPSSEKNRTLLGAGFGVRFYINPDLNFQMDLGFPFGDESSENNDMMVHLSARVGF